MLKVEISYLKVHRQIKVVVLPLIILIDHVKEGFLLELVGNISDHDRRPILFVLEYLIEIDVIRRLLLLLKTLLIKSLT